MMKAAWIVSLACTAYFFGAIAQAQTPPTAAGASEPVSIFKDRPDEAAPVSLLGPAFESQAAGISFHPPANCKEIRKAALTDEIVEYVSDEKKWRLRVGRIVFQKPQQLNSFKDDRGINQNGLLQATRDKLKLASPSTEILREDVTNIGDANVGMLVSRYTVGSQRLLMQQAIIQANDQLFYTFNFITPAATTNQSDEIDPGEKMAVTIFGQVLDSVKLLDSSKVRSEQDQRLFRTRSLLVTLKSTKRLQKALVPKQWLRILRDGKDIGYSFITEESASREGGDGVLVNMRTRTRPEAGSQVDVGSQMFVTFDWKHENWTHVIATQRGKNQNLASEVGISDRQIKRMLDQDAMLGTGTKEDPKQPPVIQTEAYNLTVTQRTRSGTSEPITRNLPPWYLPQAIGQLLPQILPLDEAKTYLFATYVSDQREVMSRYIDVKPDREVDFAGQKVRAITIEDRIGMEGVPTVHYVTLDGKYLGSQTIFDDGEKKTTMLMIPSDEVSLKQIWADANLTKPNASEIQGPTQK